MVQILVLLEHMPVVQHRATHVPVVLTARLVPLVALILQRLVLLEHMPVVQHRVNHAPVDNTKFKRGNLFAKHAPVARTTTKVVKLRPLVANHVPMANTAVLVLPVVLLLVLLEHIPVVQHRATHASMAHTALLVLPVALLLVLLEPISVVQHRVIHASVAHTALLVPRIVLLVLLEPISVVQHRVIHAPVANTALLVPYVVLMFVLLEPISVEMHRVNHAPVDNTKILLGNPLAKHAPMARFPLQNMRPLVAEHATMVRTVISVTQNVVIFTIIKRVISATTRPESKRRKSVKPLRRS